MIINALCNVMYNSVVILSIARLVIKLSCISYSARRVCQVWIEDW